MRKHGFSDASFDKWRSRYGGMDASEAKRLRELELENGKLKRLLAEAHLDIHALKSVLAQSASPTSQTRSGQQHGQATTIRLNARLAPL